jgi:uncharacterized protein (TIGR03086 family)
VDLLGVHGMALDATRAIVAGIGDKQWSFPTPCDGWNVHDLVNHVVSGNRWAAELAGGSTIEEVGDRLDGDLVSAGALDVYDASAAAAIAAFGATGALEAPCAMSYGPVPGEVYCGHRFIDVFVHGWDLAKATGQPTRLDADLVGACLTVVEPQAALLAASGAFATGITAPYGASAQQQLLAQLGRHD